MPPTQQELSVPEPLPELDTERLTIHVELPTANETDKLTSTNVGGAKSADAADAEEEASLQAEPPMTISRDLKQNLQAGRFFLYAMAVLSVIELLDRIRVANRWTRIMETSGFVDWPSVSTHPIRLLVCAVPIITSIIVIIARQFKAVHTPRRRVLRVFNNALFITAIASIISVVAAVVSCLGPAGLSEEVVMGLSTQPVAGAAFNQGYCYAWCRHTETGLAAFLRGDCGPKTTTVFDEVVGDFEVGDWCKEAIAKQNYDLVASYDGVSAFAGLKGKAAESLTRAVAAESMTMFKGFFGWILITCIVNDIQKELNKD